MSANTYEVEQKFRVADLDAVRERLLQLDARRISTVQQVDTYFAHPIRDFAVTDEAFRLRCIDDQNLLTYKGPRLASDVKTRREIELPIGDGLEVALQLRQMVEALGFRVVAEVHKRRQNLRAQWDGFQVECALDRVRGVGTFVELEISVDQARLEQSQQAVSQLAAKLGLDDVEKLSYLGLLLAGLSEQS